jgi:anthranilate phosphoribosyltransferase
MTKDQACSVQTQILSGELTDNQILDHLRLIESEGLDKESFLGFWEASKESQIGIEYSGQVLDITGTGGDGLDTFNISTLASLVCSSLGIAVAKHGNRSATSVCGSADILEVLGYNINLTEEQIKRQLDENNFAFVFAPSFNPAFRFVKIARSEFAKPTYFNLLGPLLNPLSPKFLVMGVSRKISDSIPNCFEIISKLMKNANLTSSWLVQSESGMDELDIYSKSTIRQPILQGDIESNNDLGIIPQLRPNLMGKFTDKKVFREVQIDPKKYFEDIIEGELTIKTKEEAKTIFLNIISNKASQTQTNIVILNAAAGIMTAKRAQSLSEAINLARETIESGKLKAHFGRIISNQL